MVRPRRRRWGSIVGRRQRHDGDNRDRWHLLRSAAGLARLRRALSLGGLLPQFELVSAASGISRELTPPGGRSTFGTTVLESRVRESERGSRSGRCRSWPLLMESSPQPDDKCRGFPRGSPFMCARKPPPSPSRDRARCAPPRCVAVTRPRVPWRSAARTRSPRLRGANHPRARPAATRRARRGGPSP